MDKDATLCRWLTESRRSVRGEFMRRKALDSTLFNRTVWVEPSQDMKTIFHKWGYTDPVQSKQLRGRCHWTPNLLKANLARIEIWNSKFRFLVKHRPSVFNVEERGSWVSLKENDCHFYWGSGVGYITLPSYSSPSYSGLVITLQLIVVEPPWKLAPSQWARSINRCLLSYISHTILTTRRSIKFFLPFLWPL